MDLPVHDLPILPDLPTRPTYPTYPSGPSRYLCAPCGLKDLPRIREDSRSFKKAVLWWQDSRGALGSFKFQTSANLPFSLQQTINPNVNILNHRPLDLKEQKQLCLTHCSRPSCVSRPGNLPDGWLPPLLPPWHLLTTPSSGARSNHRGSHPRPTSRARLTRLPPGVLSQLPVSGEVWSQDAQVLASVPLVRCGGG